MSTKEETVEALLTVLEMVEEAREAEVVKIERAFRTEGVDIFPFPGQIRNKKVPGCETITITIRINGGGDD